MFNQTNSLLTSKGNEISISELNQFEGNKSDDYFKNEWYYPIKIQSLISTINIMIEMLEEVWPLSDYSIYYVGFPNPEGRGEI
ncbi:hypothetical protein PBAL39_05976 [Pedobacter sp. BAL39]|nr:hypothetical protein PBAL39_05976 [Pedobacter sp. BAL39]